MYFNVIWFWLKYKNEIHCHDFCRLLKTPFACYAKNLIINHYSGTMQPPGVNSNNISFSQDVNKNVRNS